MEVEVAIQERRAVKHYDPEFQIPEEEVTRLLELSLLSPSSFNIQHWRIVRVQDKDLRQKVREASWNQAQVTEASELFIVCADINAWKKSPERYWHSAPQEVQEVLVPMIGPFYEGNEQLARDEALRSVGIISQSLMLLSKAMGYDSCPMIGFDPVAVADLINLPEDHVVGMMLTVGKAVKPAHQRGSVLSLDEAIKIDGFQQI